MHVNGLVQRPDGLHLWVARRARDKLLDPGKLDHIVAGGVPAGLSPCETLIKEAAEEAAIPPELAAQARVRSASFGYAMERPEGLRRDWLYCYDLFLPERFHPGSRRTARSRRSNSGRSAGCSRRCATPTTSSSTSTWC